MRSLFQPQDYRERKLRICERIRARAVDTRRPIAEAIEIKLENLEAAAQAALKEQDAQLFNALFAFSRFQVS